MKTIKLFYININMYAINQILINILFGFNRALLYYWD